VLKANVIRVLVLALSVVAVLIAGIPLVVLVDLVRGGTGLGVCPDGIENCPRPFTAGGEMLIILVIALSIVIAAIRVLMRLARMQRDREQQLEVTEPETVAAPSDDQ
jgi:hypothetical protein